MTKYEEQYLAECARWEASLQCVTKIWEIQLEVWGQRDDQYGWRIYYGIVQYLQRVPLVDEITPDLCMEGLRIEYVDKPEWLPYYEKLLATWKEEHTT